MREKVSKYGAMFEYMVGEVCERINGLSFDKGCTYGAKRTLEVKLSNLVSSVMFECRDERDILLRSDGETVYAYDGRWWLAVSHEVVCELIRRVFSGCGFGWSSMVSGFLRTLGWNVMGRVRCCEAAEYGVDSRYVGFTNGVYDLEKQELMGFNPKYMPRIRLGFDWDGRASGMLVERVIKDILPGEECRHAFCQFLGALFVDRSEVSFSHQCYLYGDGANGKSLLAYAVANVFGSENVCYSRPEALFKGGQASRFAMEEVKGKHLWVVDDMDSGVVSEGAMKSALTGGIVMSEKKGGGQSRIENFPLMIVTTNVMPDTEDTSWGHYRRQLVLHTTVEKFGETRKADPELGAKLAEEKNKQALFNYMMDGYKELKANGFVLKIDDGLKEMQAKVRKISNNVGRWIDWIGLTVGYEDEEGQWTAIADLYKSYTKYCIENRDGVIMSIQKFGRTLTGFGFRDGYNKKRKASGWIYCIKWKRDGIEL